VRIFDIFPYIVLRFLMELLLGLVLDFQSGESSELALRLPCKGKSVRNRGVSQTMPFLVIPRSLLRGGFILGNELFAAAVDVVLRVK
jgi:hypothetical protein